MFRKLFACALTVGLLGVGVANAQDLGAFPVDRVRESPESDLITNARLTTTSYGFVKLTTSARAVAMGDAYSAVGNDLASIFYNPAGITQLETERAVTGSYGKWVVGSTLGTFAFGFKTNVATFGVHAISFSTESFEERTSQNPGGTGRMVSGSDIAVGFTVAKQLTDKLSFGGQIRYIKEDLDLASFSTVDVNFGTVFFTGYRSTRLAMSLRNLGSDKEVVAQIARVPTVFYISGAGEIVGNLGDPLSVTASFEQAFFTDYAARYYFGGEAWFNNTVALRAGYKTRHDSESWSVGAGLKHSLGNQTLNVDISFSKAEAFNENPLRLSVGFGF